MATVGTIMKSILVRSRLSATGSNCMSEWPYLRWMFCKHGRLPEAQMEVDMAQFHSLVGGSLASLGAVTKGGVFKRLNVVVGRRFNPHDDG